MSKPVATTIALHTMRIRIVFFFRSEALERYFNQPNDDKRKTTRSVSTKAPTSEDTTASATVQRQYWPRGLGHAQRLR
jgi:hypothetical protein